MTQERLEEARRLFLNSQFIEIPGAGHIVHMDQPELFYNAVSDFFTQHGSPK